MHGGSVRAHRPLRDVARIDVRTRSAGRGQRSFLVYAVSVDDSDVLPWSPAAVLLTTLEERVAALRSLVEAAHPSAGQGRLRRHGLSRSPGGGSGGAAIGAVRHDTSDPSPSTFSPTSPSTSVASYSVPSPNPTSTGLMILR